MDLKGKIVVVTGATSGLGLAFSEALVEKGSVVYGLARRQDRLREITGDLGPTFRGIRCDVSNESDVENAFTQIMSESGQVDVLVNNAGLGRFGKLVDTSTEDWDLQMQTNLRGVFLCSRAAVKPMTIQNEKVGFGGHIVNISSVAGLVGNPLVSAYNATKFGLKGFSEALMKELRSDGIKVTCMYPGSIDTDFFTEAGADIAANPMTPQDITSTLVHTLEAADNYLISEIAMRPLRPRG
ncbi:MAG: SDR family oxidoreductase [Bacteroidetes bacterium]|nr:MAG: SDR family oxidoreductase [Bacteroidota bacterium]